MQRGRGVQFPHNQESGSVKAHYLPESDRSLTSTIMYVCMRACASSQNKNVPKRGRVCHRAKHLHMSVIPRTHLCGTLASIAASRRARTLPSLLE